MLCPIYLLFCYNQIPPFFLIVLDLLLVSDSRKKHSANQLLPLPNNLEGLKCFVHIFLSP